MTGLDRVTAARLLSAVGRSVDRALWVAETRSVWAVEVLLDSPVLGPLLDYDPRVTGPIPDGLRRGEAFVHDAVEVGPDVALTLLGFCPADAGPVDLQRVEALVKLVLSARDDPEFEAFRSHVAVSRAGVTVAGQDLLRAIVRAGVSVPVSVTHNVCESL